MKSFIKRFFLFSLPIIILVYPLDRLVSYFQANSNYDSSGETYIWNAINKGKINCDILIYGSSRAWTHFDTKIIQEGLNQKTYNLGIDGHNFRLQYLRHKELIKHNKKPKKIILSIDIFSLQRRETLYNKSQFLPFLLWNKTIYNFTSIYDGFEVYDYCFPLLRYCGQKESLKAALHNLILGSDTQPSRIKGYMGQDYKWEYTNSYQLKAVLDSCKINLDANSIYLFYQFIKECKKKNIELILVYSPEYIAAQKFIKNRNKLINYYKFTAKRFNIKFLDYSSNAICLDTKYFLNAEHLNKKGSELFSKQLVKDLK
jgi:hypothetical protein